MFKFLTKKKNQFKAQCPLSKQNLDKESSYLVSTAQIISSKKFWDNIMTEPDTMSYTEAYFKSQDATAKNIRSMIFKKYSQEERAWVISDSQIHLFDIDQELAKNFANQWWDSAGTVLPDFSKNSLEILGETKFEEFRSYAITQAGKSHVI